MVRVGLTTMVANNQYDTYKSPLFHAVDIEISAANIGLGEVILHGPLLALLLAFGMGQSGATCNTENIRYRGWWLPARVANRSGRCAHD